jgi:hypothetical protein
MSSKKVSEEELEERCIGDRDMVATHSYDVKAKWPVIFIKCAWVMFFNWLARSHIMKTKL